MLTLMHLSRRLVRARGIYAHNSMLTWAAKGPLLQGWGEHFVASSSLFASASTWTLPLPLYTLISRMPGNRDKAAVFRVLNVNANEVNAINDAAL
jgi:hypothetical protein